MDLDWRTLPSLSALRAFDATARMGGYSQAARSLNVTHAAIAQHVRALETDLGHKLVERAGRGLILTRAGAQLAKALEDGFSTIAEGVDALRRGLHGDGLKVSSTPGLAYSFIIPRLGAFWEQNPDLTVSLTPTMRDLDGFDMGIRTDSFDWGGHHTENLWRARMVLVASPDLIDRYGGDPGKLPLADMPWIRGLHLAEDIAHLHRNGVDPDAVRSIYIEAHSGSVEAGLLGLGLVIASDIVVSDALELGRLVRIPFDTGPAFTYMAVVPDGSMHPGTRIFIDWLKTLAPDKAPV